MAQPKITIRLGTDGAAEVRRDFGQIKQDGSAAFQSIGEAAESASTKSTAAADRQMAKWKAMAAAAAASGTQAQNQQRFNTLLGVGSGTGKSASSSASVFAEADAYEKRLEALRGELDPLYIAQKRYNAELADLDDFAARGSISTAELARGQALAKARFDESTAAINRNTAGLSRNQIASRLNLARQGADVVVTAAMGMNPAMIAIQQGPQILDAMATSGIKARGALILVGGAAAGLATALGVMGAAYLTAEKDYHALDRAATGLGRTAGLTADELNDLAEAGAEAGRISQRAAREMAAGYVSTGRIGGAILSDLIALTRDYAAFMGVDAKQAQKDLASAMAAPDKAGRDLTRTVGLLTQAEAEHIEKLVEAGNLQAAQEALLRSLDSAMSGHADKVGETTSAWSALGRSISDATSKLGQWLYTSRSERLEKLNGEIDRLEGVPASPSQQALLARHRERRDEILAEQAKEEAAAKTAAANQAAQLEADLANARSSGSGGGSSGPSLSDALAEARAATKAAETLADAWLESASAALKAESAAAASGQGFKDQSLAAALLAQQIAELAADHARAVGELTGETEARRRFNDEIQAGTMTAEQAQRALAIEAEIRPLLTARLLAQGDALERINGLIEKQTQAMRDANAEAARTAVIEGTGRIIREEADHNGAAADAWLSPRERRWLTAQRAEERARRDLADAGVDADSREGQDRIAAEIARALAESRREIAEWTSRSVADQTATLEMMRVELGLVGQGRRERERQLAVLAAIQEMRREGIDLESAEGRQILANVEALSHYAAMLDRANAAWDTIEGLGSDTLDRFGDLMADRTADWGDWKDAALDALAELGRELLQLSLINPFKNWAFGQNNPTVSDLGGFLGSLFGGGAGAGAGASNAAWARLGYNASGTSAWRGGPTVVGEHGPEIVDVPRGAAIHDTSRSMRMLARSSASPNVTISMPVVINADGADAEGLRRVEAALATLDRSVETRAVAAWKDAIDRRII